MEEALKIKEALKTLQNKQLNLELPGKNKALIDALYGSQGIEKFLTEEEEKEYRKAHDIASWVPSQALDSNLILYIPLEEDQNWARETFERFAEKYDYNWKLRKEYDKDGNSISRKTLQSP